jgi:hypothetical protein
MATKQNPISRTMPVIATITRARFTAIVPILILPLSASAQTPASKPPIDDCKVLAAVIENQHVDELRSGSYGADCDWGTLGVAVTVGTDKDKYLVIFKAPSHSPDGLHATVDYAHSFSGSNGFGGGQDFLCKLDKQSANDEKWSVACRITMYAN